MVIPEQDTQDLRPPNDAIVEVEDEPPITSVKALSPVNSELHQVAYKFITHKNSYCFTGLQICL